MLKRLFISLLLSATLLMVGVSSVTAGNGKIHMAQRGSGAGISLNEAVRQVKHETGGRVLSAETVQRKGRELHRVKVLTPSGQVRVVVIDAQPGRR